MHFDFGQEPAGVIDRIVFERIVREKDVKWRGSGCSSQMRRASGESELRANLLLTCGSRLDYAIMKQSLESYSVARRSWQPSHPTTVGEAPMEIDAVCCRSGSRRICRTSTQRCEQQHDTRSHDNCLFVFSWNCSIHNGIDLHAGGGSRAVLLAL